MQIVETFQNRLKEAMRLRDIKQVDLVEKTGLDKTLINKYLSGISNARQQKLTLLADALNVNEVWLRGYDVPIQRDLTVGTTLSTRSAVVFVYGIIPAGIPMECIEDVIDTEEISTDMLKGGKQYFGLKIKCYLNPLGLSLHSFLKNSLKLFFLLYSFQVLKLVANLF